MLSLEKKCNSNVAPCAIVKYRTYRTIGAQFENVIVGKTRVKIFEPLYFRKIIKYHK